MFERNEHIRHYEQNEHISKKTACQEKSDLMI